MRKRSFVFLILIIFLFLSACNNKKARIDSVYENLFSDTDLTQVVSDLEFPSNVDGVDISWKSSNPDVLSNTGKVNRLNQDVNVELQIILRAGKARVIHKITVTVLKQELDIPFVPDYSISNALSKTIGSTVTVQGVIIGFIGENAILHDGEDG
ncbi:MAG: hypothetical protein GX661_06980, partial [Acholeplasmataceae bacterium]|nr:hypothetical protein [Acholeplasmataceae bacterium]